VPVTPSPADNSFKDRSRQGEATQPCCLLREAEKPHLANIHGFCEPGEAKRGKHLHNIDRVLELHIFSIKTFINPLKTLNKVV
jgi:hypothetical protein